MKRATDELAPLANAYAAIIDDLRGDLAAKRTPDPQELRERIRAASHRERSSRGAAHAAAIDAAERRALEQLERVLAVHRARVLLAREPAAPPRAPAAAPPARRALLRTRPTITGNMEVRREAEGDTFTLAWDPAAAVVGWEIRFSERPDPRGDYVVRETVNLPAAETTVALPLGEHPLRVHVLGRSRDGRLQRRAVISALTREGWGERWQRKASAA